MLFATFLPKPGLRDRLLLLLAMLYPFSLLFIFQNKGVKEEKRQEEALAVRSSPLPQGGKASSPAPGNQGRAVLGSSLAKSYFTPLKKQPKRFVHLHFTPRREVFTVHQLKSLRARAS